MIRPATKDDIAPIVHMGETFYGVAGYREFADWDEFSFVDFVNRMIESDNGILLVLDHDGPVGMACAVVHPMFCNQRHRHCQEIFWWVNPNARGEDGLALLKALETTAQALGAGTLSMVALDDPQLAPMTRLYARQGYVPTEHTFVKRL